jgi:diketogulonate reductase-like aldo/keto reductase
VALAFVMHQQGAKAIPKVSKQEHVRQNFAALDIKLTQWDVDDLERACAS